MRRRNFIALISGAAVWAFAERAEADRKRRIGVLLVGNAEAESLRREIREGLRKGGYTEWQNIDFEVRSAERLDLLPSLATELVALKVDAIVAIFTPCALAAKRATADIPIVFQAGDAVGAGIVPNLAPGGVIRCDQVRPRLGLPRAQRFGRKSKLTKHQAREALKRVAAGETLREIALSYNVDHSTICAQGSARCRGLTEPGVVFFRA